MTSFRTLVFAGLVAVAPIGAVTAGDAIRLGVDVKLMDGDGVNTLQFWPTIEDDLATAIGRAVDQRPDGDEIIVKVRLNEVSLSGSRMLTGEGEFNRMAGWIYVYDDISKPPLDQFSVNLDAVTATATDLPENAVVMPPAKADFYETLIDAFAERAAAGIADI